ncbi:hypothetical protein T459_14530 [Capsicum annuum]|uniref:Uncharacterized protein n=1 Tax=Capsicum annuum TaxID=4072 RepID=A0A2G2ZHV7_CAPAN|nr:hypothetical protein T459_14530 [Capsicum annuum]
MMEDKQTFILAVPVLSSIYNGLNRVYKSSHLEQLKVSFPIHYMYGPIVDTSQEHGEEVLIVGKPPVLKSKPDNVQVLEDPHQSKSQDSSKSIVGQDSRELLLSSKEVTSNLCGKVKANGLSLGWRLDQARFSLIDKTTTIKESEPYLKVKEHLELVLRERDEKSEDISVGCKSLEKARKKVKKLRAC